MSSPESANITLNSVDISTNQEKLRTSLTAACAIFWENSMSRENGVTCSGFLPDSISSQTASATMRVAVEVV